MLCRFSYKTIRSRPFVCWEFFDDCFNFVSCYWCVQTFCFFSIEFWKIIFFSEFVHFTLVFTFLGIQFFIVFSYSPLYFCGISCNLSSFISNCVYLDPLSFFSWWAYLKAPRFCLSFLRTSSWIHWSFELCFYSLFNSVLILVISVLVLALGCLCCCSLSSCRCRVRSFIWSVSIFFR